jgi:protein-disulfide isomerase
MFDRLLTTTLGLAFATPNTGTTTMRSIRHLALATFAAPLALGLAACSSGEEAAGTGEPVAAVPAPAGSSWSETASRTPEGGWLVGNPDAPIKLVEYGSLTCPACALFSTEGSRALHENYIDTGRVSYELRSVMIHGIVDVLLTRVLECAPANVAVPLADQMWANNATITAPFSANQAALEAAYNLPEDQRFVTMAQVGGVTEFFAARGISADQTNACLADAAAVQALAETTQAQATEDAVTGTPTFFLNDVRIDSTRWAEVEGAIQRAGAR